MRIHELSLKNFRGFAEREFRFNEPLTLVVGENGSGKTCLLEGLCVALGGWLYGFDGLESQDKRNFIKADHRKIISKVNNALLEQVPIEVRCEATLPTGATVTWGRQLTSLKGKANYGELIEPRKVAEAYSKKIYEGNDEEIILPIVAYYSAARFRNEPIKIEQIIKKDKVRLDGYTGALKSSNSINDALNFIDRLAYLAYRDDDQDALAKMNAITNAIKKSLDSVSPNIDIFYNLKLAEFCVKTGAGEIKPYTLFSDGYRGVTSLIIDICRRIMALNPQLGESAVNETSGVILIDEIDLHLHPRWQQSILDNLVRIFPKLQFIITTHAPSVIQSVKKDNLLILDGENAFYPSQNIYGRDVNSILTDILGVKTRPEAIEQKFSSIYRHIDAGELEDAAQKTSELEQIVGGNDPELNGIKVTIDLESLED
jgi:predicted ATP-binding protein involved in virulence